jgi:hypothetical protein
VKRCGVISVVPRPKANVWKGDQKFSQAKEATDIEVQYQNNVGLFFRQHHFEFMPEGTTDNQIFYMEVLKRLTDAMRRQRGEL